MKCTYIIRKHPGGYRYIPFDYDPHPTRAALVDAMIDNLVAEGHQIQRVDQTDGSVIVRLLSGPLA